MSSKFHPAAAAAAGRIVSIESYLHETMESLDSSFQMQVTEQHCKPMIRNLLGISKLELDQQLRKHQTQLYWRRVEHFCNEHLRHLDVPNDKAPQFLEGLETMTHFTTAPEKLLSFLARGSTYKGKLDALLEDIQPDLVPLYKDVVIQDPPVPDLLRSYATQVHGDKDILPELLQCIDTEFPPPEINGNSSDDNGLSSGRNGQENLESYLRSNHDVLSKDCFLATNVLVKARGKKTNTKFNKSNVLLEISLPKLPKGMTSEFDAIVMKHVEDAIQLVAIWEAKAALHPITIQDVLFKKRKAIEYVVQDSESKVYINDEKKSYPIVTSMPLVGLFGTTLLSPAAGGRRVQAVSCEERLEKDPEAVREALHYGYVTPGDVRPKLQDMLELAKTTECCMVVASDLA